MKKRLIAVGAVGLCCLSAPGGVVGYVESNGTQYFDTGHSPTTKTRLRVDFQYVFAPGSGLAANGWHSSGGKEGFLFGISGGKFTTAVTPTNTWASTGVTADTLRHVFDLQSGKQEFGTVRNGTLGGKKTTYSVFANPTSAQSSLYLFSRHAQWASAQANAPSKMRVYRCQIWEDGTLVRDYVPWCENGVYGFYDLVAKAFSTVPKGDPLRGGELTFVPYVEAVGKQYFDTGVVPTDKTRFLTDFQYTSTAGAMMNGWQAASNEEIMRFGTDGGANPKFLVSVGNCATNKADFSTGVAVDCERRVFDIRSGSQKFGLVTDGQTNLTQVGTGTIDATATTGQTLYLFARHNEWVAGSPTGIPSWATQLAKMRVYGCRIWEGETIVRDFAPCTLLGETGFYDWATHTFIASGILPLKTTPYAVSERAYVEASGEQHVNTGIVPTKDTRVVCDMQYTKLPASTSDKALMGWAGKNAEALLWGATASSGKFCVAVAAKDYADLTSLSVDMDLSRHTWDLKSGSQKLDGVEVATGTIGSTAAYGQTLYLFGRHTEWGETADGSGRADYPCSIRLYSCQIYEGSTLVRDYVPAVVYGQAGLFDKVTQAFFASATAAPLVAADEEEVTKLYSVEAPNGQYLDTGVEATPSLRIVCDMRYLSLDASTRMMGWAASNPGEGLLWGVYSTKMFGGYWNMNYSSPITYAKSADLDRHVFDFRNGSQKIDGVEYAATSFTSFASPGQTLYLFARHTQWGTSTVSWFCPARMYSCQIYDGDTLVRDFRPRLVGGKACLYDLVHNRAYYSLSGTDLVGNVHSDKMFMILVK